MPNNPALQKAVELAGSQSELARRIGVKPQTVSLWLLKIGLPCHMVLPVAAAVEFQVTPHELDNGAYPNPWDGLPIDRARALLVCTG